MSASGGAFGRQLDGMILDFEGMNTVLPPDVMPPGKYPYAYNVRAYKKGSVGARLPQTAPIVTNAGGLSIHSLMRLNDSTPLGPGAGYSFIIGAGTNVYVGNNAAAGTGFSGNRLSMVSWRPNESVQPWMYIFDSSKSIKVTASNASAKVGIAEPQAPVLAQIGGTEFISLFSQYVATVNPIGGGAAPGSSVRFTFTSDANLFDDGHSGECSIITSAGLPANVAVNCELHVSGPVNQFALVEALVAAPTSSTIGTITYDTGSTGYCTITTAGNTGAVNNSCFQLGGTSEYVRAISVAPGPGAGQTIRCYTVNNHVATQAMTGVASLRANFPTGAGTGAGSLFTDIAQSQAITASSQGLATINPGTQIAGMSNGRLIQPTDLVHFMAKVDVPANVTSVLVKFNIDPNVVDYQTNALEWTIAGSVFTGAGVWIDTNVSVATLQGPVVGGTGRLGTNTDLGLATGVNGIQIQYFVSGACTPVIDQIACIGAYGPTVTSQETGDVWYSVYRSAIGSLSNPSPVMREAQMPNQQSVQIRGQVSSDPQAAYIDFYRTGGGILSPSGSTLAYYVGTVPNVAYLAGYSAALVDCFDDPTIAIATNQTLEFDNFEPFPSIDLPASGMCTVSGYTVTAIGGSNFNVRWAPGNIIVIAGVPFTMYNRPQSTSQLTILEDGGIQGTSGNPVPYFILEPTLLAQQLPAVWGPSDNLNEFFGCGDPLRPGTLYWMKANNPDSAPDTNQMEVTSPTEPLMHGCIVGGVGKVYSNRRAWIIYPNYANAVATITGVSGQQYTLILAVTDRGLYTRSGLCTDGGSNDYFIAQDGIYKSPGGFGSESITDDDLYNLFPHEGVTPAPVSLGSGAFIINPPDYTNPNGMKLTFAGGYLYFDYADISSNLWTLVYDIAHKAWSVDQYGTTSAVHAPNDGVSTLGTAVLGVVTGCSDGSVRALATTGTETKNAILLTPSYNAGDIRAFKSFADCYLKASITGSNVVALEGWLNKYFTFQAVTPNTLSNGTDYIIDIQAGAGVLAYDFGMSFIWDIKATVTLYKWQPTYVPQPETTDSRFTDWNDGGYVGAKFVQGLLLEADTGNVGKNFGVQADDDLVVRNPAELPAIYNGQQVKAFSFPTPFIAHLLRIAPTDTVPWRHGPDGTWTMKFIYVPYPELADNWITEGMTHSLKGWQHVREINIPYIATAPLTLTLNFDQWPTIVIANQLPATPGGVLYPTKTLVTIPANKSKVVAYSLTSAAPFRLFKEMVEVKVGQWGRTEEYSILTPFGGPTAMEAMV